MITVTQLSALFGARMKARGRGAVLNVGSTAGMVPSPRLAAYGASKAYVNAFTFAFRAELAPFGVKLTCLAPGTTDSKFAQAAKIDIFSGKSSLKKMYSGKLTSAADVARAGYEGLRKGKSLVLVGKGARLASIVSRLVPASVLPTLIKNA